MSENRSNDTGQISVAELLARNGQKVSTRSGGRRRRGAAGGISVAELTGEIPITRDAEPSDAGGASSPVQATPQAEPDVPETPRAERPAPVTPKKTAPSVPKPAAPKPTAPKPAAPKPAAPKPAAPKPAAPKAVTPKTVTPKPVVPAEVERTTVTEPAAAARPASPKIESPTEIIRPEALPRRARAHLDTVAVSPSDRDAEAPARPSGSRAANAVEPRLLSGPASDLRGTGSDQDDSTDTFGTPTAPPVGKADAKSRTPESSAAGKSSTGKSSTGKGSARPSTDGESPRTSKRASKSANAAAPAEKAGDARGSDARDARGKDKRRRENAEQKAADDTASESGLKQWVLLIGESIAAIIAGGLLFKGFERLWDLMPWVAFALALLVIVGLVALVRILRRTDDITSQLIALAVGAFVAFGPLLFLLPDG